MIDTERQRYYGIGVQAARYARMDLRTKGREAAVKEARKYIAKRLGTKLHTDETALATAAQGFYTGWHYAPHENIKV